MTSNEAVNRYFIQRFINNYGAPNSPNPDALFAEYERALAGTDEDILREAVAYVIDRHSYPNWPTVGECKKAVDHVAAERAETNRRRSWGKLDSTETWVAPTPESKERVAALMRETIANLKAKGPRAVAKTAPLPDVSRPAWEARFGKGPEQRPVYPPNVPLDASGRPDVSHDAWHARYGYKAGEIDRRFKNEKLE